MSKKVILVIMDGWGLGLVPGADAIQQAKTPFVSSLYSQYPNSTLTTCGEMVGLPDGQMGNSEVGHLNIGAGRIVYQELQRINVAIRDGSFAKNATLLQSIQYAKKNNKPLHLLGLVSDGGVHAHTSHLKAICDVCKREGLSQVFIHAFTDGRDTDPKSGYSFVKNVEDHLKDSVGTIASISGRYYAMDRDKRWERVKLAYDVLVHGKGATATSALKSIQDNYDNNITDEFIKPTIITANGESIATIKEGDAVLCFNFRTDRCREITEVLTQQDFPAFDMKKISLDYTTMTRYDESFQKVHVLFENDNLVNTLGDVSAVVKAVETVDACVEKIVKAGLENGYTLLVTADHGNADFMMNADGSPNTAHTLNLVPLFLINQDHSGTLQSGKLGDIAPTILSMMDISIPQDMTGNVLT